MDEVMLCKILDYMLSDIKVNPHCYRYEQSTKNPVNLFDKIY